ncbi:hypothetical protein [Citrobacter koseri]|uniref:hypothetical protein n=1 Tax=Citrobacter koseri TaxID=545 RepID=UPI0028BD669F|nr:hypothetical protein [Citrobacter koseri]MDT7487260.1 hypothetical protein [Citrobacter koseri]
MLRGSKNFAIIQQLDWLTIAESVSVIKELTGLEIRDHDIYRLALAGRIKLSLYFQSPVFLRKIKITEGKIKLISVGHSPLIRLCLLDKNGFLNGRNLAMSTEGTILYTERKVLDTSLTGHEYVHVQELLASALGFSLPEVRTTDINYGITVMHNNELCLLFEYITWQEKIDQQLAELSAQIRACANQKRSHFISHHDECQKGFFPVHHLPKDAHFVLRYTELEKLYNMSIDTSQEHPSVSRMSSPLTRLFWLSCWNNETIRPLINHPYKLLSIFEQWATEAGISDSLSGDTLKSALKRGSPPPVMPKKDD